MFKRKWFNLVDGVPAGDRGGEYFVSIDSALSTLSTADYSAISVVYAVNKRFYVLKAERGRWDYETLKAKALHYIERLIEKYKPVTFLIERAGSGVSLLQCLLDLRSDRDNVFHYAPKQDKVVKAAYAIPIFVSGRVFIVNAKGKIDWVEPYINEFVNFPHGRFDDQVDSLVQVLP